MHQFRSEYPAEFGKSEAPKDNLPCNGRMITGIHGRSDQRVYSVGQHCADLDQVLAGTYEAGLGNPVGNFSEGSPTEQRCPLGYAATGVEVYVNPDYNDIEDLQLICSRLGHFPASGDEDGDGVINSEDDFPLDPAESLDTDDDGVDDNADPDDDLDCL